jgi:hypothetical protein
MRRTKDDKEALPRTSRREEAGRIVEEAHRIVEEYANALREIIKSLRRRMN